MKEFIPKKYIRHLWQDELGDDFLLLKYCEVYEKSETTLGLHIWSFKKASQLRKLGIVLIEDETDDGLWLYVVDKKDLDAVISLGTFKRKPHMNGTWVKDKEVKLAHRILPYDPDFQEEMIDPIICS